MDLRIGSRGHLRQHPLFELATTSNTDRPKARRVMSRISWLPFIAGSMP